MYQVKFTTTYKKSYKLMKKRGLDLSLLDEAVDLLRQGHLPTCFTSEEDWLRWSVLFCKIAF